MHEDVFSLPEGRIVIQWPSSLSADSIQDLKDWLKLMERKIARFQASGEKQEALPQYPQYEDWRVTTGKHGS